MAAVTSFGPPVIIRCDCSVRILSDIHTECTVTCYDPGRRPVRVVGNKSSFSSQRLHRNYEQELHNYNSRRSSIALAYLL